VYLIVSSGIILGRTITPNYFTTTRDSNDQDENAGLGSMEFGNMSGIGPLRSMTKKTLNASLEFYSGHELEPNLPRVGV
jgi:hypothetical protein